MGSNQGRKGPTKVNLVNVPTDEIDLESIREEAKRRVENEAVAREPDPDWDPIAQDFYQSCLVSGQRALWEPSDCMVLYILAENLSRQLEPQFVGFRFTGNGSEQEAVFEKVPVPGATLNAFRQMADALMLTVLSRHKAGLATERKAAPRDENAEIIAQARHDRLRLVNG